MSSGLSMASVNKIKELAEAREYGVAIEIVDTQDLTKSFNPQFLRICADVYSENGRYNDARRVLVRAHNMAPEANRIIFSIIDLYLKMGYFSLADEYYHQYIFNSGGVDTLNTEQESPSEGERKPDIPQGSDINTVNYIMNKARGSSYEELHDMLFPYYRDNIDEVWSYELFLLCSILGRSEEADGIAADYLATYKLDGFSGCIKDIQSGKKAPETFFKVYAESVREDDDPEMEDLRAEERARLEEDYYRMNPKEPEITLMVDDNDEDIPKSVIRKQMKKGRRREDAEGAQTGDGSEDTEVSEEATDREALEISDISAENVSVPEDDSDDRLKKGLKYLIKKAFKKKKNIEDEEAIEELELVEEADGQTEEAETETEESEEKAVAEAEPEEAEAESETEAEPKAEPETEAPEEKPEAEPETEETAETEAEPDEAEEEAVAGAIEEETETEPETEVAEAETEPEETDNTDAEEEHTDSYEGNEDMREDMQEIKLDLAVEDIISYDFDDGFAAESDNIEGLQGEFDDYYSNPFDKINAYKKVEEENRQSEILLSGKRAEDLAMKVEIDNAEETGFEVQAEEEMTEPEVTEVEAETPEPEVEETEAEADETEAAEAEAEMPGFEAEPEPEAPEPVAEMSETEVEEAEAEIPEPEVEETEVEADESEAEEVGAEAEADESEVEGYETEIEEPETAEPVAEMSETEVEEAEAEMPEPEVDFPKFSSPLFPDLNKETVSVENTFDDIVKKENDKLREQMLKEEQMLREAQELLAKLGL